MSSKNSGRKISRTLVRISFSRAPGIPGCVWVTISRGGISSPSIPDWMKNSAPVAWNSSSPSSDSNANERESDSSADDTIGIDTPHPLREHRIEHLLVALLFENPLSDLIRGVAELTTVNVHTATARRLAIGQHLFAATEVDPLGPTLAHPSPAGSCVRCAAGVPAGALRMPPCFQRRTVAAFDVAKTPPNLSGRV